MTTIEEASLDTASKRDIASQRIEQIKRSRWIGYSRALEVLKELEDLLEHPKAHRMPNLLVIGPTNNGKTMLVSRFLQKHPAHDNPGGDHMCAPVLYVQAPPVPDENRFYNSILERVFCPYRPNEHVSKKQIQVIKVLSQIGVKVLIIDEIHHILAGHIERQRQFLNVIKYLGNELQIPIVGVGTVDALRALQTDPQLANRFKPAPLAKWTLGTDFLRLLASFEKMLALESPSNLTETSMAARLLSLSEGTIGELSSLINAAAILAIETGSECITHSLLDRLKWVAPGERKKLARLLT